MQQSTEAYQLLYLSGEQPDSATEITELLGEGFSVTSLSVDELAASSDVGSLPGWSENAVGGTRPPDCLLISDTVNIEAATDLVRAIRQSNPSFPVVGFAPDSASVEALIDAGVTELLHTRVTAVHPVLLERRLVSALALGDTDSILTRSGTDHEAAKAQPDISGAPQTLFQQITEHITDVVWVNTLDGDGLEYVNQAYETVWGRPREQLYDDRSALIETVHPADKVRVRAAMDRQLTDPDSYDISYRIVRPDGEIRWIRSRAVGIRLDGELERIVGIARDITTQKIKQQQLTAERDLVERILETSPVGIVVIDTTGEIVRANEQASTILSVSKDTLEGASYSPEGVCIQTMDGDSLATAEFPFTRIKSTGEPVWDEQYIVTDAAGDERVISVDGVPLFDGDSLERIILTFDDVTDRVRREKRLTESRDELAELHHINRIIRGVDEALLGAQTRGEVLQAVCNNLATDERYRYTTAVQAVGEGRLEATAWSEEANSVVENCFPVTGRWVRTGPVQTALDTGTTQVVQDVDDSTQLSAQWKETLRDDGISTFAAIPVVYDGTEYGVIAVFSVEEEPFGGRKRTIFDELGETVGYAIAATERREREQTLTSLYRATEKFLSAETPQEVSDVVVNTATDVLDLDGIGVFLFDDDVNLLSPVAGTERFLDFFGETAVFGPGKEDSITWHTYVTGETQYYDDVRDSVRLAKPDTSARASLLIPLGDHGVFVAASEDIGVFTEEKRHLVGLLAATTEAALDRVTGQADIRERDKKLEARTAQIERFEQTLSLNQELLSLIRDARTRTELEERLCEQLVEWECLSFAWIGHQSSHNDELEPRTWAGSEEDYLDAISLDSGEEPATRTAVSGELTLVSNVTEQIRTEDWAKEALNRGFQSVLSVPIRYGETTYGVLTLYSSEREFFDDWVGDFARESGKNVGFGINSIETRSGVLGERATELTVGLGSTETLLNRIAAIAGEELSYQEITPLDGGTTQILFRLSEMSSEELEALESELVTVDSLTYSERGDHYLVRVTVSEETVASELLECGAIPKQITASATETTVTVRVPLELDVPEFLDRLRERYPEAELHSRTETDELQTGTDAVHKAFDEKLTDRQREVLVTAYEGGYFQSPRETTGEQLAELLGLAQPTVIHHLREAQHRLFTQLFDET